MSPVYSMTGYASVGGDFGYGVLSLELRAVNHRYLEIQFRTPEDLRALEGGLRESIAAQVSRGKIDCRLSFAPTNAGARQMPLNQTLLAQLASYQAEIKAVLPDAALLTVADILRWPGMFAQDTSPLEAIGADCAGLMERALRDLSESRAREGGKLREYILERVGRMLVLANEVTPQIPQLVKAFQEKLAARLHDALGGDDADRVRQEVVLYASKIDIEEEVSRLRAHVGEVKRVLERGGAVGKRLDFLMQELNREANTLGAKSVATPISQASLELKVLIEQMREQVQNIE